MISNPIVIDGNTISLPSPTQGGQGITIRPKKKIVVFQVPG